MSSIQLEGFQNKSMFDEGPRPRGRIGFLCVENAGIAEDDMLSMKPEGVGLHFTRVRMDKHCTISNLGAMEDALDDALESFMNGREDMKVISYQCTSGSFVIGEEIVKQKIENNRSNVIGTTMLSGAVNALNALEAKKIVIGTPYTSDINELEKDYLEDKGFEVLDIQGLSLLTDDEINRVSPDFLVEFATSIDHPDAEAIFISCGALRTLGVIETIESIVGKPVITSNQASMWNSLRLAGINDQIKGFGRLFEKY